MRGKKVPQNLFQQLVFTKIHEGNLLYDEETPGPYWKLWWHNLVCSWKIRDANNNEILANLSLKGNLYISSTFAVLFFKTKYSEVVKQIPFMSFYADETENLSLSVKELDNSIVLFRNKFWVTKNQDCSIEFNHIPLTILVVIVKVMD